MNRRFGRRRLLAAAPALGLAGTAGAQTHVARADSSLPPELVLAGAPNDYIGFSPIQRFFPETGHNVDGEMLTYFRATGGVDVYGYPITEEYWEPDSARGGSGHMVQYFQRARLEYAQPTPAPAPASDAAVEITPVVEDEEPAGDEQQMGGAATEDGEEEDGDTLLPIHAPAARQPGEVRRSPLGEALLRPQPAVPPEPDVRYFPETGHNVGNAFLDFFDHHGGAGAIGLPLSEEVEENGHVVQWFQGARLEWWPENPPGQQVEFGLIGEEHLQKALRFVPQEAVAAATAKDPLRQWILPPTPPLPARYVAPLRVPVLYYHEVPSAAALRSQLEALLAAGRQVIPLRQLVDAVRGEASVPENALVLTFDDSWGTQITNAAPVLQALGLQATFFVITRYLGTIKGYMTWDNVRTLKELGHDIESHTQNHADVVALRNQNEGAAIAEIWESLSILESRLGHSRRIFAYPNGTWDPRTAAIVSRVYRGAVATGGGDSQSQDRLYALRRIKAEPSYTPDSLLKQM